MKYIFLILILFVGCISKRDETCLNGYLLDSLDNDKVRLFCEYATPSYGALYGTSCSDFYASSPRAVGDVVLHNAVSFKTNCFNRMHK